MGGLHGQEIRGPEEIDRTGKSIRSDLSHRQHQGQMGAGRMTEGDDPARIDAEIAGVISNPGQGTPTILVRGGPDDLVGEPISDACPRESSRSHQVLENPRSIPMMTRPPSSSMDVDDHRQWFRHRRLLREKQGKTATRMTVTGVRHIRHQANPIPCIPIGTADHGEMFLEIDETITVAIDPIEGPP